MILRYRKQKKNHYENLFLHSKPVKMLLALKSENIRYATQVSKHVDCTYSHTVKVLDMFNRLGLVSFDKQGRVKLVKLTDHGTDIAHQFEGISRKFDKLHQNIPGLDALQVPKAKIAQ
jgi:predicted transcriptional regulator